VTFFSVEGYCGECHFNFRFVLPSAGIFLVLKQIEFQAKRKKKVENRKKDYSSLQFVNVEL